MFVFYSKDKIFWHVEYLALVLHERPNLNLNKGRRKVSVRYTERNDEQDEEDKC